jgi:hypothetical protein
MKERSKVVKKKAERVEFKLSKRLWNSESMVVDGDKNQNISIKQKKGADGKPVAVPQQQPIP